MSGRSIFVDMEPCEACCGLNAWRRTGLCVACYCYDGSEREIPEDPATAARRNFDHYQSYCQFHGRCFRNNETHECLRCYPLTPP